MSYGYTIPDDIKSARTISEMLSSVETLRAYNMVQTIPVLAQMDRRAPGWLRIFFFGSIRILPSIVVLTGVLILLLWILAIIGQLLWAFVGALYPGWELISLVALISTTAAILNRSQGMREALTAYEFWPEYEIPGLIRWLLSTFELMMRVTMLCFVGSFLLFSLLPFVLMILRLGAEAGSWLQRFSTTSVYLLQNVLPILVGLLFLILFILAFKGFFQKTSVRVVLLALSIFGLIVLAQTIHQALRLWSESNMSRGLVRQTPPQVLIVIFIAVAVLYPLGFSVSWSHLLSWPFVLFRDGLFLVNQCSQLRRRVDQLLWLHCKRNRDQVCNDPWATLCKEHLLRFETSMVRRSYLRWIKYHYCPICRQDNEVYNGVECVALLLDEGLNDYIVQAGPTLFVDGVAWLHNHKSRDVPVFDALIIRKVDEHDIEAFITVYEGTKLGIYHKTLKEIPGQVWAGTALGTNITRILEKHLAQLYFQYDAGVTPNACPRNIRFRESLRRNKRRLYRVLLKVMIVAMLLLLVIAGFIALLNVGLQRLLRF